MCFPCTVGDDDITANADVITLNYFKEENQRMYKYSCTLFH